MSWISEIDEDKAEGKLKELYRRIAGERGKVANVLKVHSLNPQALEDHLNFYENLIYGDIAIPREQREMIAVAVSVTNKSHYCTNHHAEALNAYWKNRERIQKFIEDFYSADVSDKDKVAIRYAVKLTESPEKISKNDIENLRKVGFSDEDILNINLITAYFNFVNRITLGLGVEFNEDEVKGYNY
jgi:uncharacterized peroxidase-related enzyme